MRETYDKEAINALLLRMKSSTYDKEAFNELYKMLRNSVYLVAKQCFSSVPNCKHDIDDIVGNTFVTVIEKVGSLKTIKNGAAWIFKIAENLCKKLKRKRHREVLTDEFNMECANDFESTEVDRIYLGEILKELSHEERAIIVLNTLHNLTLKEIAGVLNISIATVNRRIKSTRERYNQLKLHE